MNALYEKSIALIKQFQHQSGAYVACPNFENYNFSWLRDGSFIAYAMDVAGEHESASKFHDWVNEVISRYGHKVEKVEAALEAGSDLDDKDFLFTRYTLEGAEDHEDDGWGNFQYDGYGTWLWALKEHIALTGDRSLLDNFQEQIALIVRYLTLVWKLPSYDCWEEHPELLHPYSIAAAYGGLNAVLSMAEMGLERIDLGGIKQTKTEMKAYVARYGIGDAGYLKHISPISKENPLLSSGVDSSLMGLAVPYGMFELEEEEMASTVQTIKKTLLSHGGGVYRFLKDSYYGGGEWILLTAWLGWVESLSGDALAAKKRLAWIEDQVNGKGWLPEQVEGHLLAPEYLQHWQELWGKSATPLLWSHAMYIILYKTMYVQ
jgi:GH15 family glucan-1,4-alpha-glucosidase